MITAICSKNDKYVKIQETLYQYDYGQKLKIQGLQLPKLIEIQFSLNEQGGETITRVGITESTATYVTIPDALLENNNTEQNYNIFAFVYVTEKQSGKTEYKIPIRVKTRPRPEEFKSEEEKYFDETVQKVSEILENTENIAREAEAWAHGHESYPERDEDNAKYYATLAADTVAEIPGEVEGAKKEIDEYVSKKEHELKGETGNVYFAAFKVVNGRLKMYSDTELDKVRFVRAGSRLLYRLAF